MGVVMIHFGSFVLAQPVNPRGAEAQLGAMMGFICALPAHVVIGFASIHCAKQGRMRRALLLAALPLVAISYFLIIVLVVRAAGT